MKNIHSIAKILRFAGFKAKADNKNGVITINDLTSEAKEKIESMYNVEVVAA